jgi:hypothetical protein
MLKGETVVAAARLKGATAAAAFSGVGGYVLVALARVESARVSATMIAPIAPSW